MGWFGLPSFFHRQVYFNQGASDTRKIYVCHRPPPAEEPVTSRTYPSNRIVTSKYTVWNFLPKNLFEQFRRIANFYFLCIAIIQLIIDSPVTPVTSLTPLVFVVTVTAVKQAYEDWRRHQADKAVNIAPIEVIRNGELVTIKSEDIKVGDIVLLKNEEEIPCDLVMLSSNDPDGRCHITTANLDGETNLKIRECLSSTKRLQTTESLAKLHASIECQEPTPDLYHFIGRMNIYHENGVTKTTSLGCTNMLLRGAKVKNTPFVFGCAVYTGQETKMALNLRLTSNKFSTVERSMNKFLLFFLFLLLLEVTACTVLHYYFMKDPTLGRPWYLPPHKKVTIRKMVADFLSFLVILNYIIPISLYVTLEMVKFIGALFITWDADLFDVISGQSAKYNSSDLNEELGQVEYLFTDKTGTLTENDMRFRQCSVKGVRYIEQNGVLCKLPQSIHDPLQPLPRLPPELEHFFMALALCNTVQVEKARPESPNAPRRPSFPGFDLEYQASSPDEKALVEACRRFGIVLLDSSNEFYDVFVKGTVQRFQKLHILEFTSERKRMSVIVKNKHGDIYLFCKGAESSVLRVARGGPVQKTLSHVNDYALEGLRTLVIAQKLISKKEYAQFNGALESARNSMIAREDKVSRVFDQIERHLQVLGATAVEDRLQDGVCETLESLKAAGIKIWVLTGDKLETAVNISYSCGHMKRGTSLLYLVEQTSPEQCNLQLLELHRRVSQEPFGNHGLIIDGQSLKLALDTSPELLREIGCMCLAVLCCRMSPLQKSEVVRLLKFAPSQPITAAVGDGANDVSMIQEAHVGLGIMGKEGLQAVRCSDFAFARFRFLKKILLVHGHYYYVRVSTLVLYFFYKNIVFITPQFMYIFFTAFSSQPLYDSLFLTFYNMMYTAFPILVYGLCEQDAPQEKLLVYPNYYREISRNAKLSRVQFCKWILQGLYHAIVLFWGYYFLWSSSVSWEVGGQINGMWTCGTIMCHTVVIIVNLKLGLHTRYWTGFFFFSLLLTVASFIGMVIIYSSVYWHFSENRLYQVYLRLFLQPVFWLSSIAFIVIALLPDFICCLIENHGTSLLNAFQQVFMCCCRPRENLRLLFNKETGQIDVTMSQINILEKPL